MKRGTTPYDVQISGDLEHIAKRQKIIPRDSRDTEEDKYFAEEEASERNVLKPEAETNKGKEEEEEVDSLDAFMMGIQQQLIAQSTQHSEGPKHKRDDIEEEDPIESFVKHRNKLIEAEQKKEKPNEELEYDSDDNPIIKKKAIEPLPPLDHSKIHYEPFEKNFYEEHEEIAKMSHDEIIEYRKALGIRVQGNDPVAPVKTFEHFGFDEIMMEAIKKEGYDVPTPIQRQAVPLALMGRDVIGIAKTGSGKTAAYVWPMIIHILDQPELRPGEGPIAVVVAPTRELAHQIYLETKKFSKGYNIRVAAVYGGASKLEQVKTLKHETHEIVVCTPGRLIDMIKAKAVKMNRVTFLVLDEADRMFDLGFEPQVRSIVGQIRPDRQTLLFSATMKPAIEQLARDILTDPIRVTVGQVGVANEDVTQVVHVVNDDNEKWQWLMERLKSFVAEGSVLIFGSTKQSCEELSDKLVKAGFHAAAIHGDKTQNERTKIMHAFKSGNLPILVATDVASRGLDIKAVKTVVNYHTARDIESHIHRVGRTGRAGDKEGIAFTLITKKEDHFAAELVKNLEGSNQRVPPELLELAMKNPKFKRYRTRGNAPRRGKGVRGGRRGRSTAGLGYTPGQTSSNEWNPRSSEFSLDDLTNKQPSTSSAVKSSQSSVSTSKEDEYNPEEPTTDPQEIKSSAQSTSVTTSQQTKPPTATTVLNPNSMTAAVQRSITPLTGNTRAQILREAMMARFKSSFRPASSNVNK